MKKYAKIINKETKQCEIGIGTNIEFYKSIGMSEMDVEQSSTGEWYLAGYIPIKPITTKELSEFIYEEKCKVAYYGVTVRKSNKNYIFETSIDSIAMAQARVTTLATKADNYKVTWKTWPKDSDLPETLEITKSEFIKVFEFASEMIEQCFAVESKLNSEILKLKDSKLADVEYINQVKQYIAESFKNIKTTISL